MCSWEILMEESGCLSADDTERAVPFVIESCRENGAPHASQGQIGEHQLWSEG